MNILVLSWRDLKHPLAGGAEQVMHEHMKGWVAAGHQVTHFSSRVGDLKRVETIDGVNLVRSGYQYLGVQLSAFIYYLSNRKRFDLLVDEFHGLPFFTPVYCRKPKVAVIQEVAGMVWFLNPLPKPFNWLVGWLGYILEPLCFIPYRHTGFITGSESAKQEVAKLNIRVNYITVVPHGVLLYPQPLKVVKERLPTVVYLGILSKDKGIEDAIEVFNRLDKQGDWNFWVIGRSETADYLRKIQDLIKRLDLRNQVKFFGFVSQEEKFRLLSKAQVLINPSVKEGWGLVNIEANSVGTPVVAYDSAGLRDSVRNNKSGILVKRNTPEEMAKVLKQMLGDPVYYRRLCRTSKEWSKNFSWERSRKISLKLIEGIVTSENR